MKNTPRKWHIILILSILLPFLLSIQKRAGHSFPEISAYNIKNPMKMEFGSKSSSFVSGVGGVSFDQIAFPDNNLTINSLDISYHSENEDGKRLELTINEKKINVDLYDWLLVPIAKYSESPYY